MLDRYDQLRRRRLDLLDRRRRAQAQVAFVGLEKRLLSSIKAFSKTLDLHIRTLGRALATAEEARLEALSQRHESLLEQFAEPASSDDDDAELNEGERQKLEDLATEAATLASVADATIDQLRQELDLARQIQNVAAPVADRAESRVSKLAEWIDENLCPGVTARSDGSRVGPRPDRRLLIFTEYEDTPPMARGLAQDAHLEVAKERYRDLLSGFDKWRETNKTAKRTQYPALTYILLHSVSHMLLQRIALGCGYPLTSLRERVYAVGRWHSHLHELVRRRGDSRRACQYWPPHRRAPGGGPARSPTVFQ
jgi:hypothetical protein